jgi:hypothetical protein
MKDFSKDRKRRAAEREVQRAEIEKAKSKGESIGSAIAENLGERIKKHYSSLADEAQCLLDEKHEIMTTAINKRDLAQIVKDELKSMREEYLMAHLLKVLERSQRGGGSTVFHPAEMRVDWSHERTAWMLWLSAFSEDDIDRLCSQLPDVGLSLKDQKRRIDEIDARIEVLRMQSSEPPPKDVVNNI